MKNRSSFTARSFWALAALLFIRSSQAQTFPNIRITPSTIPGDQSECTIAIDPVNSNRLLAAWNVTPPKLNHSTVKPLDKQKAALYICKSFLAACQPHFFFTLNWY